MIQIDMRMPKRCFDCPCLYWVQSGEHEGDCICNLMNCAGLEVEKCLVDMCRRPKNCPMTEVEGMTVWYNAALDLPKEGQDVLAVKELKNGRREICIARCIPEWEYTDPVTLETSVAPFWVCGGNNNIIYWMPLPKMPEKEGAK